jgi:nucleoside-diphosphate-sugar epimerase
MDMVALTGLLNILEPQIVIHLAARTDTMSDNLDDYSENIQGTRNLLEAIKNSRTILYFIFASTQYVYKSNKENLPATDFTFLPHTVYGESKRIGELLVRESGLKCAYTIIRPTNVWGPWHMRYPNELWKMIDKGLYLHPLGMDPLKSYAYVKNVVHQLKMMLYTPSIEVDKQVYYVGDYPIKSKKWLNTFSLELRGKKVLSLPKFVLYFTAILGSLLNKVGVSFPLSLTRYRNMIDDYDTPMQKTIDKFGLSHPDLTFNVKETMEWVRKDGRHFFKYWDEKY